MEPIDVLRAFWAAMCEWERNAVEQRRSGGLARLDTATLASERAAIIERFCTHKRRVYSQGLSFGEPPQYDPDVEDVLETLVESSRRVVIRTRQSGGWRERRRYVMVRRGEHWLLDSWQLFNGDKWVRGII